MMVAPDSPAARLRALEARGVVFRIESGRVTFQRIEDWRLRSDALALVTQHHDWLKVVLELGPRLRFVRRLVEAGRVTDR
jgi:hypothetical protein